MAFARLFWKFDQWRQAEEQQRQPCLKRMNVLAHSMGNRVLVNAMEIWINDLQLDGMPQFFRNVFMVAADVENECLEEGERGRHIVDSAKNTVVYYASDDLAMPASKVANIKARTISRRMGMTGPENLDKLPKRKVFEVDCDDFNSKFDFPLGHSYFLSNQKGQPSPVIMQIQSVIRAGKVEGGRSQCLRFTDAIQSEI